MLTILREKPANGAVKGEMYINGAFVCFTLENASKAIPEGLYKVENSQSPKFKRELPLIYNEEVKASRGIRIHAGNSVADSSGCVLVGMGRIGSKITESKSAEAMVTMLCRNQDQLLIIER